MIFRRGPSKWVQIIKWDSASDRFLPGAWFHGRIYEKRCDVSPDGTKLVYFAQKINRRTLADKTYTYAWTAISKPPWLTALALWPKGDCWDGGGLFETNTRLWLNHPNASAHKDHQPKGLNVVHNAVPRIGEDEPIFERRLERDGWRLKQEWQGRFQDGGHEEFSRVVPAGNFMERSQAGEIQTPELGWCGYVTEQPAVFEKLRMDEDMTLVMSTFLEGFQTRHQFSVGDEVGQTVIPMDGATWADWDQQGRLVFVAGGKVCSGVLTDAGELAVQPLADFNNAKPESKKPPEWARVW